MGTPNPILPGMFVGLGACGTPSGSPGCMGPPPVSDNPLTNPAEVAAASVGLVNPYTNAAIYGYGLPLDQVIFHSTTVGFDLTAGVVTWMTLGNIPPRQAFDFVVGNTGGGSYCSDALCTGDTWTTTFDFGLGGRTFRITGPLYDSGIITFSQTAHLTVGFDEDTLMIDPSDPIPTFITPDGMFDLILGAEGPVTAGDPGVPIIVSAPIPLPPTLALLGLGLAVLGLRRRQRAA